MYHHAPAASQRRDLAIEIARRLRRGCGHRRRYPRGSPRPRVAITLRCTSEVPPRIVAGTART